MLAEPTPASWEIQGVTAVKKLQEDKALPAGLDLVYFTLFL